MLLATSNEGSVVTYYFVINDNLVNKYQGYKYWWTTGTSENDTSNSHFIRVPSNSRMLMDCDTIIGCGEGQAPYYVKSRSFKLNTPVTEDLTFIILSAQQVG